MIVFVEGRESLKDESGKGREKKKVRVGWWQKCYLMYYGGGTRMVLTWYTHTRYIRYLPATAGPARRGRERYFWVSTLYLTHLPILKVAS